MSNPTPDEQQRASKQLAKQAEKAEQELQNREKNSQQSYAQTVFLFAITQIKEVTQQMQQSFIGDIASMVSKLSADMLVAAKSLVPGLTGSPEQKSEIRSEVNKGIGESAAKVRAQEQTEAQAADKQRKEEQERQRQLEAEKKSAAKEPEQKEAVNAEPQQSGTTHAPVPRPHTPNDPS